MKRAFIIAALVVLAAASGFFMLRKDKPAGTYREVHPRRGPIAIEFRETGSVSPRNRLEIKPQVTGRIEEVLVREGEKVKKGQIIAWMSSTDRAALLDAARAQGPDELKKWEDIYRPTPIIAPLNGFIIARSKEPGQTVSLSDVILVMADTLIIEADTDETDLRYIRLNQEVSLYLDAYPDAKFKGIVEHIAYESTVVNNVTVYTVKIRPLTTPPDFRAGMTATIEVSATPNQNALLLPYDTIKNTDGRKSILVKSAAGIPEARDIEIGTNNGKLVEVTSGITENDIVLVQSGGVRERKSARKMPRMGLPGMGGGRR